MKQIIFIILFFALLIGRAFSQEELKYDLDSTKTTTLTKKVLAGDSVKYTHKYFTIDGKEIREIYYLKAGDVSNIPKRKIKKLNKEIALLIQNKKRMIEMIAVSRSELKEIRSKIKFKKEMIKQLESN